MTKEQEYTKPYLISQYAERYGLKKMNVFLGDSFASDCSFWETEKEGAIITDYRDGEDLEKRGMLMLLYRKGDLSRMVMISLDVLEDEKCFKYTLEELDKQ